MDSMLCCTSKSYYPMRSCHLRGTLGTLSTFSVQGSSGVASFRFVQPRRSNVLTVCYEYDSIPNPGNECHWSKLVLNWAIRTGNIVYKFSILRATQSVEILSRIQIHYTSILTSRGFRLVALELCIPLSFNYSFLFTVISSRLFTKNLTWQKAPTQWLQ
jgi:hypothetical protein